MKTISNATPAFVSGAQESARLQIEANGKAFKELISGIYSDKTYAIARELIANAWDAHVLAGNENTQFDLHLPTVFDPTFSIRDYGTSMDHNTVMTLYRTLFRSTKDDPNSPDSNKFVGKFGLGSKSPFAYTDAFQLTTYLDGIQRVYDIYFNAGAPMISLFLEVETDEPNGVLITFPVESKDVDDFARAAARAMEPLVLRPNLTGRKVDVPERSVLFSGLGWKLLDGTFSDVAEALQGTVLYPLRFASIPNCPLHLKPLIEAPLRIEFEIGQLDVTTSRENLSYDDLTTANILTRLEEIVTDIKAKVEAELASHSTYFAWSQAYFRLKNKFPGKVWTVIENNPPKFKGRYAPTQKIRVKLGPATRKWEETKADGSVVRHIDTMPRFKGLELCVLSNQGDYQRYLHDNFLGFKAAVISITVPTSAQIVFVTQDKSKRVVYAHERMKVVANKFGRDKLYIWIKHPEEAKFALDRLYAYLGRPELVATVDLSTIEVPEQVKVENTRDLYKVWDRGTWESPRRELPVTGQIYYVMTRRGDVDDKEMKHFSSSDMHRMFASMKAEKLLDKDDMLIAVPVSAKSQFFNVYEAEPIGPLMLEWIKTKYSREDAALQNIHTREHSRWVNKGLKHKVITSPPWIYCKFEDIAKDIGREYVKALRAEGVTTKGMGNKEAFEKLIAGTCIEDAYIFNLMLEGSEKTIPVGMEKLLAIVCDFDKAKIAAEEAEIDKRRKYLQHQFNVAGGKVHNEFPVLGIFRNYNVNEWTKKFILRAIREKIGA